MTPTVLNLKTVRYLDYVIVDRSSPWGNPFVMDKNNSREDVCNKYELYAKWRLTIEPNWLLPLIGKNLACHCAPLRCHADILLKLANINRPMIKKKPQ